MPEAAIDETVCRQRLLEHVEDYQQQVDDRLTSIQAQIAGKFIIAYKNEKYFCSLSTSLIRKTKSF